MGGPLAYWINAARRAAVPVERGLTHDAFIRIPGNAERLGTTLDSALNSPAGLATLRNNAGNLDVSMLSKMSPAELRALAELTPEELLSVAKSVRLSTPEVSYQGISPMEWKAIRSTRDLVQEKCEGGPVRMATGGALRNLVKRAVTQEPDPLSQMVAARMHGQLQGVDLPMALKELQGLRRGGSIKGPLTRCRCGR